MNKTDGYRSTSRLSFGVLVCAFGASASNEGLASMTEGPPVHHADYVTPTLEQQLAALRSAGFSDAQVVWRRMNTVVLMAKKGEKTL